MFRKIGEDANGAGIESSDTDDFGVTWSQITAKQTALDNAAPMKELRRQRDLKLAETTLRHVRQHHVRCYDTRIIKALRDINTDTGPRQRWQPDRHRGPLNRKCNPGQARDLADGKFDTILVVDAANNRVGIGTTSPDRSFHITSSEPSVVLENSGQGTDLKTWRIYSNSSSLQVGTVDDAFAAGQNALEITRDNTDNITGIQFKTGSSSEIARFTTDGLTFNGDTATANALDDYEEGTWTPAGTSLTVASGTYTKIGRFVTLNGIIESSDYTTNSVVQITGVPFTIADRIANTSHEGQGAVSGHNNNDSGKQAGSCIARSQGYIEFHHGADMNTSLRYIHHSNNWSIRFTITFFT